MKEHLRWHLSYHLPLEFSVPYDPVTTSEVDQHLCFRVIHREGKSISFHPTLISKRFCKSFTKCEAGIFNRVVFVNMQISIRADGEVHLSMPRYLLKHVVEEA